MARWLWILPILLLLCAAGVARAQIDSDESKIEVDDDDVYYQKTEASEYDSKIEDEFIIGPAPDVETVYFFPNNPNRQFPAGQKVDFLVGISNNGQSPIQVDSVVASLHYPLDHAFIIQNLTNVVFVNSTVAPGAQATYAYPVVVHKMLQPGGLSLVAKVNSLGVDNKVYQNIAYNGTVEIVEPSGYWSGETAFLVLLGLGLLGLLGLWVHGQIQKLGKNRKAKTAKTVETGTRSTDAIDNEWLQGTAFMKKEKKPKKGKKESDGESSADDSSKAKKKK